MQTNERIHSTQEYTVNKSTFYYGWTVIIFSAISVAITTGIIIGALPHFFKSFINEFGWNRTVIGLGGTIALSTRGMAGMLTGELWDRYGPRRFMWPAVLFTGLTLLYAATISTQIHFYTMVFGIALCVTLCGLGPSYYLCSTWFKEYRGIAMAIIGVGLSVGGIFFPPLTARLILNYGWRATFITYALIIICVFTPFIYKFIKDRPAEFGVSPDPDYSDWFIQNSRLVKCMAVSLGIAGLYLYSPLGTLVTNKKYNFALAIVLLIVSFFISMKFLFNKANATHKSDNPEAGNRTDTNFGDAISSWYFWILLSGSALTYLTTLAIRPHFVLHVQSRNIGFGPLEAAWAYSTIYFFGMAGGFVFGYLSDKYNKQIVNILCAGILLISNILLLRLTGSSVWMFCLLYGLSYSGLVVTTKQMLVEKFGIKAYGKLLGIIGGTETIFGGIGTLFMGRVYDTTGSYSYAFQLLTTCTVIAVILFASLLLRSPIRSTET